MQNELNNNNEATTVVNNETASVAKKEKIAKIKEAKKSATNIPKKKVVAEKKNVLTVTSKKGEKILASLNLSKYANALSSYSGKEKSKKDTIYVYPENMTELQKSSDDGKRFRNGLRNQILRFANNVLIFAKMNRKADLQIELTKFEIFYKANYRINDFTFASISQSKQDAKTAHLTLFMQIAKDVLTSKKK